MKILRPLLAVLALLPAIVGAEELSQGEVRRIDAAQGKITLKHGPIVSLDMPPMTMIFFVDRHELLDNLKVGDRVRFAVEEQKNQKLVITQIEPDQ